MQCDFEDCLAVRFSRAVVMGITGNWAFAAGTVLPAGASTAGDSAHRATWPIAYTIGGVRDWLFAQSKAG